MERRQERLVQACSASINALILGAIQSVRNSWGHCGCQEDHQFLLAISGSDCCDSTMKWVGYCLNTVRAHTKLLLIDSMGEIGLHSGRI